MDISLKKAVSVFYATSSFDDVYCEAVANAIDAGASRIDIGIKIKSFSDLDGFEVKITDNGEGFNQKNFDRFSKLLEVANNEHKGVGRLVYLSYFKDIEIDSIYDKCYRRRFVFDDNFDSGRCSQPKKTKTVKSNKTTILFRNFLGRQLNKHANVQPSGVRRMLLYKFMHKLYTFKNEGRKFVIKISSDVASVDKKGKLYPEKVVLALDSLPELERLVVKVPSLDLFHNDVELLYSIKKAQTKSVSSVICVDGRNMRYDLMSPESIPSGYEVFFMISSDALSIDVDAARQKLVFPAGFKEDDFKKCMRIEIAKILKKAIPDIENKNGVTYRSFQKSFPHLCGLYDDSSSVGLVSKKVMMEEARVNLYSQQERILGQEGAVLSEEDFQCALQLASRSLTEYVLYRSYIINKLKCVDKGASETDIHNIISPRYNTYNNPTSEKDVFNNNIWLLDDKFMSYDSAMSDKKMKDLLSVVAPNSVGERKEDDEERPDISIVFSANPEDKYPVDVVIVELKRYNIDQYEQEKVIEQLKERARNLVNHYGSGKINQIWFFGILEMTDKFKHYLREHKYKSVFSKGEVFYNRESVIPYGAPNDEYDVDLYLMTYETLVKDAEARNESFMSVLRKRIRQFIEERKA